MNTKFLETLVWLNRLGNFSRTAEKLHATQPAISSRINALEDMLGVELYVRGSRPLELTRAGVEAAAYAERMLLLENELLSTLKSKRSEFSLKIGVIEVVTVTWLTQFASRLSDVYENLVLEVSAGLHGNLIKDLYGGRLDMVLTVGLENEDQLVKTSLCDYDLEWMANPAVYPVSGSIDILEIAKFPIILTKPNSSVFPLIRDTLIEHGLDYVFTNNQRVKFDCVYSFAAAVHLTRQGAGIMPLIPAAVLDDIKDRRLAVIEVNQVMPKLRVTAYYLESNSQAPQLDEIASIARAVATDYCTSIGNVYAQGHS